VNVIDENLQYQKKSEENLLPRKKAEAPPNLVETKTDIFLYTQTAT
jgi:hypothetical protein